MAELMKDYKFKINLHKSYFEKGYGLTHYLFKLIAVFGLTTLNFERTFILAGIYTISCYFLGWAWFRFGWFEKEIEVNNQFNLFVREMRKVYKE